MEFVITQDGSPTLFDFHYKEHHHSMIGAYTEARYKFIEESLPVIKNLVRNNKKEIRLLDLPFGLGYNFVALLKYLKEETGEIKEKTFKISCFACEKDKEVIKKISEFPLEHELKNYFRLLEKLVHTNLSDNKIQGEDFRLSLFLGDLLDFLPRLSESHKENFDLIFYDPFSPRTAPELWSKENVLKYFYELLDENGLFITYTASNKVRKGLLELGFEIYPSSPIGRKMPGTLASKSKLLKERFFTEETQSKINRAESY